LHGDRRCVLISGLAAGTYTVSFLGQLSNCGVTLQYGQQSDTAVHVGTGATTRGVDAALLKSSQGEIDGTVTDAKSGAALPGIAVTVYDSSGSAIAHAMTDALGPTRSWGLLQLATEWGSTTAPASTPPSSTKVRGPWPGRPRSP
jgi:hypothetical protein